MSKQEHLEHMKQRCYDYRAKLWEEIRVIEPEKWWKLMPYYHKQLENIYNQIRNIEYAEILVWEEEHEP